jgi:sodium-dependent dicarboxylate transporter 2/3/5
MVLKTGHIFPIPGAALVLFVIPVQRNPWVSTMDWDTANRLPWGLLVLFGGGLSLAAAIRANGLGEYLGQSVGSLVDVPTLALILGIVTLPQMVRAGIWLNLIAIVIITTLCYALVLPLLGIRE